MSQTNQEQTNKPVVALTLGDAAGVGAELIAKLLNKSDVLDRAHIVIVGDQWLWQAGQKIAQTNIETHTVNNLSDIRAMGEKGVNQGKPMFYEINSISPNQVEQSVESADCGKSQLHALDLCLDACMQKSIDSICFAPLNKTSMKLGGMKTEDELHYFAEYLNLDESKNYICEFNTMGSLWTSRISSHIPLKDIPKYVTKERIQASSKLIYQSLQANGIEHPRVAVAALNPHAGENGTCGMEEIEIIEPAVKEMNEQGLPIHGPLPADTIFIKAREGEFDAIVTMFHDQGQIAIKLMGFERGVTVQGGLPIPITTPAHGTAYDITGQNKANVEATYQAFLIAVRMGKWYNQDKQLFA